MKVNGYRCDRCKAWMEEDEVTDTTLVLKGRVEGEYRQDLCVACVEKIQPRDEAEPVAKHRRRRRTPSQRRADLATGTRMLAEGWELPAVLEKLEITDATWQRWTEEFPDIAGVTSVGSGAP